MILNEDFLYAYRLYFEWILEKDIPLAEIKGGGYGHHCLNLSMGFDYEYSYVRSLR